MAEDLGTSGPLCALRATKLGLDIKKATDGA